MNTNELENKIRQLKEIKPNQEWVSLLKSQILNPAEQKQVIGVVEMPEQKVRIMDVIGGMIFQNKFAYATATLALMVVGVFGFVNYTMPGDIFYPVKKVAEQVQPNSAVQMAYNRSEDLVKVVRENKTQNLTPAIDEYKNSVSDAVKDLTETLESNSDKTSVAMVLDEVKKLQENQKQLEVLGVNMGNNTEMSELDTMLKTIVENQIADFEETTLTVEQQTNLANAKDLYEQGKYSEALEVMLQMDKQI